MRTFRLTGHPEQDRVELYEVAGGSWRLIHDLAVSTREELDRAKTTLLGIVPGHSMVMVNVVDLASRLESREKSNH